MATKKKQAEADGSTEATTDTDVDSTIETTEPDISADKAVVEKKIAKVVDNAALYVRILEFINNVPMTLDHYVFHSTYDIVAGFRNDMLQILEGK